MDYTIFDEMKAYVGKSPEDAEQLVKLRDLAVPLIPAIVDRFYDELFKHESARQVFAGPSQIEELRRQLSAWLADLFGGEYGESYFKKQFRIGETHVRVGLPQRYMLLGMELIWQELLKGLARAGVVAGDPGIVSLHKLISLDLAVMLESYTRSHAEVIRLTEKAAMEDQLSRAQHLAEIGQLAASLAHEIKNPLAGISGAIQIIGDQMARDDPHRRVIRDILGQVSRLDATVRDLLLYARPNPPRRKPVPLSQLIQRVVTVLSEEPAVKALQVEMQLPLNEVIVDADEGQLEQLFMNLVLNAAQASSRGEGIRVGVEPDTATVKVRVIDRGKGMTEEVLARAQEPFFTTKARGTGLGLSICRRIADAHGADLIVESEPERGTAVTVVLPVAHEPARHS